MVDSQNSTSAENAPPSERGWKNLQRYVMENRVDFGLWATRVITILFTIGYIIPIFGNPYNCYYKALMSNAATSALRLHQRVPRVQLNMQFLMHLMLEDSCHYILYSLIFLYVAPVTLVIFPVFLFAVMHLSSTSLVFLDCLGQNSCWPARLMISLVEFKSRTILRLIALSEILVLPFTILLLFTGRAVFFTPLVYYQFLKLRLSSQRNPFTRNVFYEMRDTLSYYSEKTSLPGILRKVMVFLLKVTEHMAPVRSSQ